MTRLAKTRGIVIRHSAYSETSRVIHWFTEDHGRITTLAKGAMRPRNPLLGQFDQMYTCELVFYAHDRDAVFITREVDVIAARPRLRRDWRASLAGLYLCDLIARTTPSHEPAEEVFQLLEDGLDGLDADGWLSPLPLVFEIRLLGLLGFAPRLDACASCERPFEADSRARFDVRRGGLICRRCRSGPDDAGTGADVLAILRHWQSASGWQVCRTARCTTRQMESIRHLLGEFIGYHLEVLPASRIAGLDPLYHEVETGAA